MTAWRPTNSMKTDCLKPTSGTEYSLPLTGAESFIKRKWVVWLTLAALVLLMLFASACTVTPVQVKSRQASFDGNQQNSGLVAFQPDGSAVITPHAHDRYTNLLASFGKDLPLPPKYPEEGMFQTNGTFAGYGTNVPVWIMDAQHLNYFKAMNRWRKQLPTTK